MTSDASDEQPDRRVRRTRSAIVSAFNRLVLERGYASLTPRDVAAAADVGRSTFYAHFRGIDELLATTLEAVLAPLARGCFEARPSDEARRVVEHVWENRRLAHLLFNGEARNVVLRCFAAQFEEALKAVPMAEGLRPTLAPDLIALHLAAGHLALLDAWLLGRSGHTAEEIATALHASGHASAFALIASRHG